MNRREPLQPSPVVLVRAAGGSFGDFEQLEARGASANIEQLLIAEKSLERRRQELLDDLFDEIGRTEEGARRARLVGVRRAVLRGQRTAEAVGSVRSRHAVELQELDRRLAELAALELRAEREYDAEVADLEEELIGLAGRPAFRHGVALASSDLARAIDRYLCAPTVRSRRKRRTLLGATRYLSRFFAKTSPFSRLSRLGLATLAGRDAGGDDRLEFFTTGSFCSVVSLNSGICGYLKETLAANPGVRGFLGVEAGLVTRGADGSAIVAQNHRNRDRILRVQWDALAELVLTTVQSRPAGARWTFDELVSYFVELGAVEADAVEIKSYLGQLLEQSLLVCAFSTPSLRRDWEASLAEELAGFGPAAPPAVKRVLEALSSLGRLKEVLAMEEPVQDTGKALREAAGRLRGLQSELASASPGASSAGASPAFPATSLVFEDWTTEFRISGLGRERLRPILEALETLWREAEKTYLPEEHARVRRAFVERFGKGRRVPLLEAWSEYVMEREAVDPDRRPGTGLPLYFRRAVAAVEQRLLGDGEWPTVVKLPLLERADAEERGAGGSRLSRAAFLQLYDGEPEPGGRRLMAALNFVAPGYGKMLGRFLEPGSERLRALQRRNERDAAGHRCAELRDRSCHSVNARSRLFPLELLTTVGEARSEASGQVRADQLWIEWVEKEERVRLVAADGLEVVPIDSDIEVLEHRSSLFRYLAALSPHQDPVVPAVTADLEGAVEAICRPKQPDPRIVMLPRILLGSHLVLQRRTWLFPLEMVPHRRPDESEWTYTVRLRRWQEEFGLPSYFFASPLARGEWAHLDEKWRGRVAANEYKPQLVSFRNPFLVRVFENLTKKTPRRLIVREMLPAARQLPVVAGGRSVVEVVVEWSG